MKPLRGLYIVTPNWDDTAKLLDVTEKALKGGATIVQYRHKTAGPEQRRKQATALQALCKRYDVPFIINDHVDLCLELDADGIHVGETDESVAAVRARIGPDKILGASCYGEMDLVQSAINNGATYIALGGFYPSVTKSYDLATPLDMIGKVKKKWPDMPSCAIGGITPENAIPMVEQGIDMISVISHVYLSNDPEKAARDFADMYR
ncbi:MAG: thiamine phosphate synthase [Burkholderiaceae bacterium]|nr:thiamine phosphate synthase [Burkholderiaceae bacterium]